jgi:two-component system sensor histidine kinase AtoS
MKAKSVFKFLLKFFNRLRKNLSYKVIEKASALFIYIDADNKILICNATTREIIAKNKTKIIGKNWRDVLTQKNNFTSKEKMFQAIMDDSIIYKRQNYIEDLVKDANNVERVISWNINPLVSHTGELEGLILIGDDITELQKKQQSLKKIDDTLKNIFSSIREYALYVINLDNNITYFGMGSEIMFGWEKNEIILKNVSLLYDEEDAKTKLPAILEKVRNSGRHEVEMDLVKKDGRRFPVIMTVSQFLDPEGKLMGYTFIAKDITERKKLEYQVFQAEKLAAIGQLSAGMAHEINNPLFVISGRLEMSLEDQALPENIRENLNITSSQVERIRKLADRMLKFARQGPLKSEIININETIENVLPFLAYQKLPPVKIEIEKELAGDLNLVRADLNQMQEVFINLLLNAYQSMTKEGKLHIRTRNLPNEFIEIRISDTGKGIEPQYLKNIFMPFFSTKKEGTGLGLSICYNIIKNHGGSIDIETEVNKGTTFIIKLPFAQKGGGDAV